MSGHTQVDALILGSGTGGTSLALHLARSGQRVAVVEKRWIGGSCPNVSCLPTKNEIWSAKIADSMRRFTGEFGHVARSVAVDMTQVRQRKREMVRALNVAVLDSFDANRVQLIMGEGRFVAPRAVGVHLKDGGTSVVSAERVFLDLGTHAAMPDIAGLPATHPMTHIEILELDRVPPHLIVLGGGYVGLELAQAFRRFGSRVTIVEHGVQLAGREDPDVGAEIASFLTN
jgi:pyruvate/2-oxoglutarate dehydrogenase complex dihydrolipoamide dehydrogenase (E3) component